jgi:hypothetical protein
MRIYLAGPMTGLPEHNFPAFHAAAARIRAAGHTCVNPAESFGSRTDLPTRVYRHLDLSLLLSCDALAVLPNWNRAGSFANIEVTVARSLDMPVLDAATLEPLPEETVCQEAQRLVYGDRGETYGHPFDDFTRVGRIWGAILGLPYSIPAEKVAMLMIGLKLARECYQPKRDNRTDIAGYAECLDRCAAERERRRQTRVDAITADPAPYFVDGKSD